MQRVATTSAVITTARHFISLLLGDAARRGPGVEDEADPRADPAHALDLELAAEHLDALAHAGEAEATKQACLEQRGVAVEAAPVVFDGDLDRCFALCDAHADMPRAAVLAD